MSTTPVTPDQSTLASTVNSSGPSQAVAAVPTPSPVPPASSAPASGPRLTSVLSAIVSASQPTPPPAQPAWKKDLGTVARTVSTALAGVPSGGRPSFLGGLGQGARSEQAAQAQQQDIKFKDFESQYRAAQLHNDDLRLQNQTDEQQNANQKEWMQRHDWLSDHGYDDFTVPNHGPAVINHMTAETSANGAIAVTPGTAVNPDGNTIHVPTNTQATRDAQKQLYDTFAPIYGLGGRDPNADFVPGKQIDILQHLMQGKTPNGDPIKHDDLPGMIASYQAQRTALNGKATEAQQKQLDNTIGILQANLKALDDHAAQFKGQQKGAEDQAAADVINNPTNQANAARGAGMKAAAEEEARQAVLKKFNNTDYQTLVSQDVTGWKPPAGVALNQNQQVSAADKFASSKAYTGAQDAERSYQMMQSAYGEYKQAAANGQTLPTGAQSMVALSTHLQTTFGNVKGARVTKDMIQEHLGARSVSDSALVATQRLTNGDVLSPDQWSAFNGLISQSRGLAWGNAIQTAHAMRLPVTSDLVPSDIAKGLGGSQPSQQFSHVSASGKFGWNGTQWVPTGK